MLGLLASSLLTRHGSSEAPPQRAPRIGHQLAPAPLLASLRGRSAASGGTATAAVRLLSSQEPATSERQHRRRPWRRRGAAAGARQFSGLDDVPFGPGRVITVSADSRSMAGGPAARRVVEVSRPGRRDESRALATRSAAAAGKKRVLILISDTGGGHRASAEALEAAMEREAPGRLDVAIVDVWTQYGAFPFNKFVPSYRLAAKYPNVLWRSCYFATSFPPLMAALNLQHRLTCSRGFAQHVPLSVLARFDEKRRRRVPFATVVTDLGSAHRTWFDKRVDACFVPSDAVRQLAGRQLAAELQLSTDRKTVLIVGGGDGVGSLEGIVKSLASEAGKKCPGETQLVVVCGKNARLQHKLERQRWEGVDVCARGFTSRMSDYMEVADCIVTKAGPGTVAEAAIRGLPTMLSSFLPGQEAGNVPFVVESGFGEYSANPRKIALTVTGWLQDATKLEAMSEAAARAGQPHSSGTIAIASDLQYEKPTVERLRHGDAEAFRFDRYQSPAAVKAAFDGCRSRRSFRTHEASDGRRGLVSSTRLGGDWVLAESEQLAPACTAEEVLRAYLTGSLQKEWNADKVSRVAFSRAASPERGRYYRQDIELRSVRVIRSRTGPMSYSQTISVDKARKPFEALSVYVGLQQVGPDVRIYAAGVFRVNRRVVPNLVVFDASGIAGDMAGKGTLWLAGHFERRRVAAAAAAVAREARGGAGGAASRRWAGAVRFLRGRVNGGAASSEGECGRRT
ncbi:hypothetical protein EMIHUDRAFT_467938 [Emiliania huxleyi CCMP1516]|uniref:monogalactosyldiacylglycerol synthase n=2 Tax=Emiliania huxleyi TaxID=2903 RepID=A0A0D3KAD4_EMIH1|nr:hypothetical protein EMIHUDRAFT_467938 [Emiliania huxleyi CCMP1516]EOD32719.1 hypothetical protein EMIHUDRAFT_467938 [Emiliania huxleyi CCMP1516]|eukprot:XP_005785148.1 hypothetical protein EMIHUDRAFT_467938 [Emiliania huxleyi CCMP1516]